MEKTSELGRSQSYMRKARFINKERQSLETLRELQSFDTDRPSLAFFIGFEIVKWGGLLLVALILLRFFYRLLN